MKHLLRGLTALALNALFLVVVFVAGLRFLSGQPVLPELTATIAMWQRLLGW